MEVDEATNSDSLIEVHELSHKPDRFAQQIIKEKPNGRHENIRPKGLLTTRKHITVVCVSDTHNKLDQIIKSIPDGDILIHAGDFTMYGTAIEVQRFVDNLVNLAHKHKIIVAGNHELGFDSEQCFERIYGEPLRQHLDKHNYSKPMRSMLEKFIYLENESVELYGYKFYGSPVQPTNRRWAFNVDRGSKILQVWNQIPSDIDVLITHGPPCSIGDRIREGRHVGCVELYNTVMRRVQPLYHVFGHVHEGYGVSRDGQTTFINASICTAAYTPRQAPIVFHLPLLK